MILTFVKSSLARQFLLISFPVLLAGMLVIGSLIGRQVEESVVHRMGSVTGMYVDSMVAPHVQSLATGSNNLNETERRALNELLTRTPLGQRIVAFKIWRPDGTILYSADKALIGKSFPVEEGLAEALSGDVHSEISTLNSAENAAEAARWPRLVETYTPIHAIGQGSVIAAAEFYQTVDEVLHESFVARRKSWMVVASVTGAMYLTLFALVRRGSQTIEQQRRDLNQKVEQLTVLNLQNERLRERIWRAAASSTAVNENFLRRISADLHDGPGQDLSFALMRFELIWRSVGRCKCNDPEQSSMRALLESLNVALASALKDMRTICAGLRLPEIDLMGIQQIAMRAIRDYEGKTGVKVELSMNGVDGTAPLPIRIALYRLLQESLANGFRHAGGAAQRIDFSSRSGYLQVRISDKGPGFDYDTMVSKGGLGLAGMRDRVELLGGSFLVHSAQGHGTDIEVSLPLTFPETEYG
jgi:signal transduction histidine kinase